MSKNSLKEQLKHQLKMELARRDFWEYCKLMAPSFYTEEALYLKKLCRELQDFYESKETFLIINLPPRHGKSRTMGLFTQWVLGNDIQKKVMTGSYNETLSTAFSKSVRNAITQIKADDEITVFNEIFPWAKINRGDGAMNLWALEGSYFSYLATSPGGTATGFGADIFIIDDLIKNSEEAYNDNTTQSHWDWFTETIISRLEEGAKLVVVMTRWVKKDLAGRLMEYLEEEGLNYRHINMKAQNEDGSMLCDRVLSLETYMLKKKLIGEQIALANYQQVTMDSEGSLYKYFKTYDIRPEFDVIKAYVDTADQGKDYLCAIVYGVYKSEAYILDILYTQEGMEKTEYYLADMLYKNKVNLATIESNNGGRGFARNVERIIYEKYRTRKIIIKPYTQSRNKRARILSNSHTVMEHVYFPNGWSEKYPEYYRDMNSYQKEGKNAHDDAPDCTTGVVENLEEKKIRSINKKQVGL